MRANEFGTNPKRPSRPGSRPARGHEPQKRYVTDRKTGKQYDPEEEFNKLTNSDEFQGVMKRMATKEARMSNNVKLQRAWEREQEKSAASYKRGQEYMNKIKQDVADKEKKEKKVDEIALNSNRIIDAHGRSAANPYGNVDSMGNPIKSAGRENLDMDKVIARAKAMFKQGMHEEQVKAELVKQGVAPRLADQAVQAGQMNEWVESMKQSIELPVCEHCGCQHEVELDERGKASKALCISSRPDSDLGASNLASCKSQGLRARDGNKSHKLGKGPESRVKVGGHKIKGHKYGGPLPDWS